MADPKKAASEHEEVLDNYSRKRGRGRPRRVNPEETWGRGDNYRRIFNVVWHGLWPSLSQAQTEQDVISAFEQNAPSYREFVPALASLVLKVIRDPKFPKRRQAQINYIADSLAAYGWVSPRRSRDICQKERLKEKRTHRIIRYEFKIECSCGYKGFSHDHACPKCKAKVPFPPSSLFGPMTF